MMEQRMEALGMIETLGIPALVAAADAAAKAAAVRIGGYEKADAGIVTVYIVGDVASVKAAVEAGAEAARRLGLLLASHVIPRPDSSVPQIMEMRWPLEGNDNAAASKTEPVAEPEASANSQAAEWAVLPVQALRRIARQTPGFPLSGRQISTAGKAVLLRLLTGDRQ